MRSEESYQSWQDFEKFERRRVGTFQLCVDDLAKDLYIDQTLVVASDDYEELNFDL